MLIEVQFLESKVVTSVNVGRVGIGVRHELSSRERSDFIKNRDS